MHRTGHRRGGPASRPGFVVGRGRGRDFSSLYDPNLRILGPYASLRQTGYASSSRHNIAGTAGYVTAAAPFGSSRQPDGGSLTMCDEARNTRSHRPHWGSDANLRRQPVAFVSAGLIDPLEDLAAQVHEDSTLQAQLSAQVRPPDASHVVDTENSTVAPHVTLEPSSTESEQLVRPVSQGLVANTRMTEQAVMGLGETLLERGSTECVTCRVPNSRDSNGLFYPDFGRDVSICHEHHQHPDTSRPRSPSRGSDSSEEIILFRGRGGAGSMEQNLPVKINNQLGSRLTYPATPVCETSTTPDAQTFVGRSQERLGPPSSVWQILRHSPCNFGKHETPAGQQEEEDEIIADYIANMDMESNDEAEPSLLAFGNRELGGHDGSFNLGAVDGRSDLLATPPASARGGASHQAAHGSDTGGEDGPVQVQSRHRSVGAAGVDMNDKPLAALVAKQDQMGTDNDELVIFNGLAHNAGRSGKPRGAKKPPVFNMSDAELEAQLQSAWHRDRERKKRRKAERDELRCQGLLGRNPDPTDLCVKYPQGVSLEDMKEEFRLFLLSSAANICFPPMDKQARKLLHELANKFSVTSKSTGNGQGRRPILYRNKHTTRYGEGREDDAAKHIEAATERIKRKYFFRPDAVNPKGKEGMRPTHVGGRTDFTAISYRDGEVVGASAPEIGQENKGRAMLEKMGWSKGMALGTLENKGILEPVAQVVKRSKAGLG